MPSIKLSQGYLRFKTIPIYLGMKYIDKVQAAENLSIAKQILDRNRIGFMIIAGTLLGAMREHDFISHDEDIDLAFLAEDKQRTFDVLPQFIDAGFKIARYDRRGVLSVIRNNEYIDFYFFDKHHEEGLRTSSGWLIPERFLIDTASVEFKQMTFRAPKEVEDYLCFEYGPDWGTPVEWNDFGMPKWKRWYYKTKEHAKDLLPDALFFKLAGYAEKIVEKDYRQRLQRYLNNGGHIK